MFCLKNNIIIIATKGRDTFTIKKSKARPFFLKKIRIKSTIPMIGINAYFVSYRYKINSVDITDDINTANRALLITDILKYRNMDLEKPKLKNEIKLVASAKDK